MQLTEHFSGVSKTIKDISAVQYQIGEIYNRLKQPSLEKLYKGINPIIENLESTINYYITKIKKEVVLEIEYKEVEMESLIHLSRQWQASKTQAALINNKVMDKKEMLFDKKLVEQWNLSQDHQHNVENLLNSKEAAFKVMLPIETQELTRLKDIYGYYSNRLKEEFERVCGKNAESFIIGARKIVDESIMRIETVIF